MSGNDIHRRSVLALASAAIVSISGCLGFLGFDSDDSGSEDTPSDGNEDSPQEDSTPTENESGTEPQSNNETGESENETNSTNEAGQNDTQENTENDSNNESDTPEAAEPEANPEADPSDHEYAEPGDVDRPTQKDLTITDDALTEQGGTVGVSGILTNVSDATVDVVDIEVTFLDSSGEAIYQSYGGTNNLEAGASWEFFIPAHGEYGERAADYELKIVL